MFWHQEMETLDRPALDALQLKRLRETVRRLERVPFYRAKFLRSRPQAGRDQIGGRRAPAPFHHRGRFEGELPRWIAGRSREEVLRLHTSSGTTGKPKALFFSRRDVDTAAELIARAFCMTGVTRRDVFQNMMSYGLFTGGLVMHYGAEKVGCMVIPAGPGTSERQLLLMQDFGTTVIHVTPSYAFYFADFLEKRGLIRAKTSPCARPSSAPSLTPRKPAARSKPPWALMSITPTA